MRIKSAAYKDRASQRREIVGDVEREVSRVRDDLERMQGRMRVLQDLTSLATVTLYVDEIKGYVPPQNPTFAVRISRAFDASWDALATTSQSLAVAAVAFAPWAVALGIPGFGFVMLIRRLTRRSEKQSQ
ncbi:MAG TPA: DUF4349 domain-containing protein [Planctomycetaceae bacterium]